MRSALQHETMASMMSSYAAPGKVAGMPENPAPTRAVVRTARPERRLLRMRHGPPRHLQEADFWVVLVDPVLQRRRDDVVHFLQLRRITNAWSEMPMRNGSLARFPTSAAA
jgi:hypothetical protein